MSHKFFVHKIFFDLDTLILAILEDFMPIAPKKPCKTKANVAPQFLKMCKH